MSFVHGHARDTGWVVAHVRPPIDAEEGQLRLVEPAVEEDEEEGGDAPAACTSGPVSSASTRS